MLSNSSVRHLSDNNINYCHIHTYSTWEKCRWNPYQRSQLYYIHTAVLSRVLVVVPSCSVFYAPLLPWQDLEWAPSTIQPYTGVPYIHTCISSVTIQQSLSSVCFSLTGRRWTRWRRQSRELAAACLPQTKSSARDCRIAPSTRSSQGVDLTHTCILLRIYKMVCNTYIFKWYMQSGSVVKGIVD